MLCLRTKLSSVTSALLLSMSFRICVLDLLLFSRLRKYLVDFSPSSYQSIRVLRTIPSVISLFICSDPCLTELYSFNWRSVDVTVILFSTFKVLILDSFFLFSLPVFLLGVRHAKLPHFKLEKVSPDDRIYYLHCFLKVVLEFTVHLGDKQFIIYQRVVKFSITWSPLSPSKGLNFRITVEWSESILGIISICVTDSCRVLDTKM